MAQSTDTSINAGLSGLAVRNGINENLAALFSSSSGATAPASPIGGQLWLDISVSPPVLRMMNYAGTAWKDVVTTDYATSTGLALIQAASAAAARSAIGAPPAPQAASGVGQWYGGGTGTSTALVLPAGGTWAYFYIAVDTTYNGAVGQGGGVAAGGTTVSGALGTTLYRYFFWRIA